MNLYYANKKVNELAHRAHSNKKNPYYGLYLSDFLWECEQAGYIIQTNKDTGEISIFEKR
jgi:hypothetical protein